MDDLLERFLSWRGIDDPCDKCGGAGTKCYASTATWVGGIGGQAFTSDVCDECWGTGDKHRKGADLRKMSTEIRTLRNTGVSLLERAESAEAALCRAREALHAMFDSAHWSEFMRVHSPGERDHKFAEEVAEYGKDCDEIHAVTTLIVAALSPSALCAHKEDANRLREDWEFDLRVWEEKYDDLRRHLILAEKVVEAARKLMEHAMPTDCNCQGCVNMRDTIRAYDAAAKEGGK